jgi:proteasome lid subunit RPN8/RPN11
LLKVNQAVYTQLRAHGEQTYPHECCGVLLGHATSEANLVEAAVAAGNTRTDSAHNRYHIAPGELIRIQREGREKGLEIVGFYHSHPDHPAQWSKTDFAEAHWLGCSYVITAVEQGKAVITNSFRLEGSTEDDKQFVDEPVALSATELHGAAEAAGAETARC